MYNNSNARWCQGIHRTTVEFAGFSIAFLETGISLFDPGDFFLTFVFIIIVIVFAIIAAGLILFSAHYDGFSNGGFNGFFGFDSSADFFIVPVSNGIGNSFTTVFAFLVYSGGAFSHIAVVDCVCSVFDRFGGIFVFSYGGGSVYDTKNSESCYDYGGN